MSKRLTDSREKPAWMLSLRLPEDLKAAIDAVKDDLARATPGLEPARSDAVRVLLREAIAARAAQAARAAAPPAADVEGAHRAVPREAQRGRQEARREEQVAHTAANGQLSLLSRTANDTSPPMLDVDELRRRLVASGASTREIAANTGVSKTSVHKFMQGHGLTPKGLAALAGFVSQAQP